jgi:hypothetical protein
VRGGAARAAGSVWWRENPRLPSTASCSGRGGPEMRGGGPVAGR